MLVIIRLKTQLEKIIKNSQACCNLWLQPILDSRQSIEKLWTIDYGLLTNNLLLQIIRKEVIQPHLPVRLPCYDLAPVTNFTFSPDCSGISGTFGFHRLTGGVYKARERIHGGVADPPLLAIPASWSRIADSNPNWACFLRLAPSCDLATYCCRHCNTCVAQGIRAVLT